MEKGKTAIHREFHESSNISFAWNTGFRETKTVNQQNSNESVFLQSSKLKPPTRCFKNPTHSGISGCELFRIGPCLSCGNPLLSLNNS